MINLNGRKLDLTKLNYVESRQLLADVEKAGMALNSRLALLRDRAIREFGVDPEKGSLLRTTATANGPALAHKAKPGPKKGSKGPMSEEQKQKLRDAQNKRWALKKQGVGTLATPSAFATDDQPRLVPPGTHDVGERI